MADDGGGEALLGLLFSALEVFCSSEAMQSGRSWIHRWRKSSAKIGFLCWSSSSNLVRRIWPPQPRIVGVPIWLTLVGGHQILDRVLTLLRPSHASCGLEPGWMIGVQPRNPCMRGKSMDACGSICSCTRAAGLCTYASKTGGCPSCWFAATSMRHGWKWISYWLCPLLLATDITFCSQEVLARSLACRAWLQPAVLMAERRAAGYAPVMGVRPSSW